MQIAPSQKREVDLLDAVLSDFERTVARENRQGAKALRRRLDEWAAKVAVIGQVKAGKSTFMNAFLRQQNLLPSDVNPWTSVVTNLRINVKNDPEFGAKFEFFSEEDWDEILDGNSQLRALSEKLLPGFDTDLLKEQVVEMRDQARARLGDNYTALLGSEHDYDFLSPELLQAYVCAGRPSNGETGPLGSGRYSAITKAANVYMRMPEYAVPVIITDTPGVNDPFLVRDEYTCRNLDKSDLFIVVLSAHQALTGVDISLIRLLAAQENNHVMIFINRIDELDDYVDEVPEIVKDVENRLTAALPEMGFSIYAGSAFMAEMALSTSDDAQEARDSLDSAELSAYLMEEHGYVPEDQIDRLLLGSGLDRVKQGMSDAIDCGVGASVISQIHESICAEVSGAQFATKHERNSVQLQAEKFSDSIEGTIAELEKEIDSVKDMQTELDLQLEALDTSLEKLMSKFWSRLEKDMNDSVSKFVLAKSEEISEKLMRVQMQKGRAKFLKLDVHELLLDLETLVSSKYEKSRAGIDTAMFNCSTACKDVVSRRLASHSFDVPLDKLPNDEFSSTLTLSKTTLDIPVVSERSWAIWRGRQVSKKKTIDVFEKIALADLRPAIEKILKAYSEAQSERAAEGIERIRVMLRAVDTTITGQNQRLQRFKRQLHSASNSKDGMDEVVNRLQSQLEVLDRRLQKLSVISSKLSESMIAAAA